MGGTHYNYAAALVAYIKGTDVETIARTFLIPAETLRNKIRTEAWARLANGLTPSLGVSDVPAAEAERGMARIRENREKNLAVAQRLQEDLAKQVEALMAGTLEGRKVLANGRVVTYPAGVAERVALVNYAKNVAELSYRALGDVLTARETEATPAGAQTIVINMPAQVANPRVERGEVLDAQMVTVVETVEALPSLGSSPTDETTTPTESSESEQREYLGPRTRSRTLAQPLRTPPE